MKNPHTTLLLGLTMGVLCGLALPSLLRAEGSAPSVSGYNKVRIEHELRLKVPPEKADEVWAYLLERYDPQHNYLRDKDPNYSTKSSVEQFVDRYYDTVDYKIFSAEGGLRHRTRWVLSNPLDEKNGRQLIQMKIKREADNVDRSEVKFKVNPAYTYRPPRSGEPILDLVMDSQRSDFANRLAEGGMKPEDLRYILTVNQTRRRIYIAHKGVSLGSITIDEALVREWGKTVRFAEIETEPSEIGYTDASPEQRAKLAEVMQMITADLATRFPDARREQTPKYRLAVERYQAAFGPAWRWLLVLNLNPSVVAFFATTGLLAGGIFWARKRAIA